ncbi:Mce family protein MceF [Nocardia nova SH22a]|uniref:Mce family protein MceF n=1 Tax=Nocardia nova SH22a TaxID=1415166 RepID=W5TMJ9_9NOCA|nr:MlaD family protein [Nocardia nova]AHH18451.1 Mce family protein MceF [Nocardia nova SH22a]
MSRAATTVSLAAIAAILVFGCAYLTFGVAKVDWPPRSARTATVLLPDSGGLVPRSKVLLSGIQIGHVTTVSRGSSGVDVSIQLDGEHRAPAAGPVRIENLSALGEPYLEFTPPDAAGPYLPDGARIQASRVRLPASIPDLAAQTTALLQQVDPEVVESVVHTFGQAFAGTDAVMPELGRSTQLLAATLLSRTDTIRKMLVDLQAHADDMEWAGPALTGAAEPWGAFGPKVSDVIGSFSKIIQQGDVPRDYLVDKPDEIGLVPLLDQLSQRITKLGPDLSALLPVLAQPVASSTNMLRQLDISALISQALAATSADGALQLQINVK